MVNEGYKLLWTRQSQKHLLNAYEYISHDSPQNARKVVEDILALIDKICANPEIYSLDKYKTSNDGTYRAFERHRYRVSYRFSQQTIRILRIRHTSMLPLRY